VSRRALLALSVAFVALRLLLVLSASDRIHAPDWAEVKHSLIGDQWIEEGVPTAAEVLDVARDPRNAAHGGFLALSALYAALTVPLHAADSYLALKLAALAFATLAFVAWVGVATRLAGAPGGWLAALLLLAPPPAFLAGSMITWGSHAEASALLGLAALALLSGSASRRRGSLLLGLALGCTAAMSSLYLPIVGVLLLAWLLSGEARDTAGRLDRRRVALALGGFVLPLLAIWLLNGGATATVTEEAGNTPLELLSRAGTAAALIPGTLANLIPLPTWGPDLLGSELHRPARRALDAVLSLLLLGALFEVARSCSRRPGLRAPVLALLVIAPAVHLGTLLLLGPRRPSVEMRYLLPLWPIFLVALAVAASWAWQQRSSPGRRAWALLLLLGLCLWLVPGLQIQASLLEPARIGSPAGEGSGFFSYQATRYVDHEVGNVSYATAPGVNDFLSVRGEAMHGFGLVPRLSASQSLLREHDPPVLDAARILDRIQQDRATQPRSGAERAHIYQNIGWALAVFADDRPGLWHGLLSRLGTDREDTAAGLGMGLSRLGEEGCKRILGVRAPDGPAMLRGAIALDPAFAQRCAAPAKRSAPATPAQPDGEQR